MSFVSFNEKYYLNRLTELEQKVFSSEGIYEARQMLKLLDDLMDEGYTELNDCLEQKYSCVCVPFSEIPEQPLSPSIMRNCRKPGTVPKFGS